MLTGNTSIGGASSWPMTWDGSQAIWKTAGITTSDGATGYVGFQNYDPLSFGALLLDPSDGTNSPSTDDSCNPLHFHIAAIGIANPGSFGRFERDGITDFYIDDTEPSVPASCDLVMLILGCNGMPVDGANVDLQVSGSTVDTQTTDSTGEVSFSESFIPSNGLYTTVTSKSRFTSDTSNWDVYSDGLGGTVTLIPTSSYKRTDFCADPVANTLHATHPAFGAITLTYNASGSHGQGWYASVSYSYSACQCCSATTVTVTCFLNTGLAYTEYWKSS